MNRHRVLAMTAPFPPELLGTDKLIPAEVIEDLGRRQQVAAWTGFATLYGTREVARRPSGIRAALKGVAVRTLFFSSRQATFLRRAAAWIPGKTGPKLARTVNALSGALELTDGRPNETALPLAYWRNVKAPAGASRDPAKDGCGLIWYSPLVPMRPQMIRAFVDRAQQILLEHRLEPLITFTSMGDKLFACTIPLIFERQIPAARDRAKACYAEFGRAPGANSGAFHTASATTSSRSSALCRTTRCRFTGACATRSTSTTSLLRVATTRRLAGTATAQKRSAEADPSRERGAYFLALRRVPAARPSRPMPSRASEPGSGTSAMLSEKKLPVPAASSTLFSAGRTA